MAVPILSTVVPRASLPAEAPWMDVASEELDRWHWSGQAIQEGDVDWDQRYFAASPYFGARVHKLGDAQPKNSIDWCAAFVNYCLHRTGYSHTGSAGAASFLRNTQWRFEALAEPRVGCVIVMGPPTGKHVAFLDSVEGLAAAKHGRAATPAGGVKLLGGNQSNTVMVKADRRAMVSTTDLSRRKSPYLWPLRGEANCNIGLETTHPHHCGHTHSE